MRHPFAVAQLPRPQSFFSIRSRPSTPESKSALHPDKRQPIGPSAVPPLPSILPLGLTPNRSVVPQLPAEVDVPGHFVRHSSKLTLLLSGQRGGSRTPCYSNGDTVEGVLAIARPSGVLALDVRVEGTLHVQEIAGKGAYYVKTIDEKIYSWIASSNGSFPPKASFRYTLPDTYRDPKSGREYPLPPTFSEEMHGIPGFSVKISYAIVVNITLLREASTLWRGVSNVRVPFRYLHRTRPSLSGPFPSNALAKEMRPRTLFTYEMRSGRWGTPPIKVQEPIPFHVTLHADELTLEPFAEYRPMPSSFLSLETSESTASFESVQHQLSSRKAVHKCPLRIKVQRTTVVNASSAGFTFPPFYPRCQDARNFVIDADSADGRAGSLGPERSYMHSTQPIGHGVVHSASRSLNTVVWSGAIIIPPTELGFSGGFEANGVQVVDSIVLCIDPPARRSHYSVLNETMPIRLTTDSAKSHVGVAVSTVS